MNSTNTSRRRSRLFLLLGLVAISVSCAESIHRVQFGLAVPDNEESAVAAAMARIRGESRPHGHAIAYGVGGDPSELFVVDIEDEELLWSTPADVVSWPHATDDLIVTHEGSQIIARDIHTGARRFAFAANGLELVGASGRGALGAFTLSTGGHGDARSELVITNGAQVAFRLPARYAMGVPAVAGGMALVPWGSQFLSFVDATTSEEVARIRLSGVVLGNVITAGDHVFAGQNEIVRVTETLAGEGAADAARFTPPEVSWPGRPAFLFDPYQVPPRPNSAAHRVRLAFSMSGTEDASPLNDAIYDLFHRVVFSADARSGELRWAHLSHTDLAGAGAASGGLLVGHTDGSISTLDAETGAELGRTGPLHPASVMRFRAEGFTVTRSGADVPALPDALYDIAAADDTRVVPAGVFATHALGALAGDAPTAKLLEICQSETISPAVQEAGCETLSARREGHDALIAALERHTDFVEGTVAPPIGAIARATAGMNARDAAPLLVAHLKRSRDVSRGRGGDSRRVGAARRGGDAR